MDANGIFGKSCPDRWLQITSREKTDSANPIAVIQEHAKEVCLARNGIVCKQCGLFNVARSRASSCPAQSRHHQEGAITSGWNGREIGESLRDAAYSGAPAAAEAQWMDESLRQRVGANGAACPIRQSIPQVR